MKMLAAPAEPTSMPHRVKRVGDRRVDSEYTRSRNPRLNERQPRAQQVTRQAKRSQPRPHRQRAEYIAN
jgi:hypothetical protein